MFLQLAFNVKLLLAKCAWEACSQNTVACSGPCLNFLQTWNIFGSSGMKVEKSKSLTNLVCHSYIRNLSTSDADNVSDVGGYHDDNDDDDDDNDDDDDDDDDDAQT